MGTVVVIGSSNIDLVVKCSLLPGPGETVLGGEFFQAFGGKGANQAVAAARSGADTYFIGSVGNDSFGKQMLENLKGDNIAIHGISIVEDRPSGTALIMLNEKGENIIAVAPGANGCLCPGDIEKNSSIIEKADIVLIQLEISLETVYKSIEVARSSDIPVILNPAPAPVEPFDEKCLSMVACIIPNKGELETISGMRISTIEDIKKSSEALLQKGVGLVVVTLGEKGVFYINDEESGSIPSKRVSPVDTVGAGDCFSGCLAAAISEKKPLKEALEFAVAGAALSVTKRGAQPSLPKRREIEGMMRDKSTKD